MPPKLEDIDDAVEAGINAVESIPEVIETGIEIAVNSIEDGIEFISSLGD